jgi:hypothetical protein
LTGQNQYHPALADLNQAIKVKPHNPPAYNARGNVNRRLCRYDDAILDFETAIRQGSTKRIRFYQVFLKQRRFYDGDISGEYKSSTRDALLAFVHAHDCVKPGTRLRVAGKRRTRTRVKYVTVTRMVRVNTSAPNSQRTRSGRRNFAAPLITGSTTRLVKRTYRRRVYVRFASNRPRRSSGRGGDGGPPLSLKPPTGLSYR